VDPDENLIRQANDVTQEIVARRPDVYCGLCYLNPANDPAFLHEEIEARLVHGGFRGIKLWVSVNARDPRVDPIMERAAEWGVPVLFHAWYKTVQRVYNESDPSDIAHLAARFPHVPLIMAHLTGAGVRGVLDVKPFPNVHVDTSGSQPHAGLVEFAVRHLGARRVVFGSDVPGRDFAVQLGRVYAARITERQRALILGGNAQRLLKLGDERNPPC
jgi:predicted TIM-barrel fold metal-dependent hydrolase